MAFGWNTSSLGFGSLATLIIVLHFPIRKKSQRERLPVLGHALRRSARLKVHALSTGIRMDVVSVVFSGARVRI